MRDHWWWRLGWRPGRRFYTFHVTWRDQPAVQELAAQARARLAQIRGLDPVPGQWLHLTTQGIGFTDEVSGADLAAITAAARARLAAVHPVLVQVGPPKAASEGVACWVGPPGALDPVRDALRAAIGDEWGTGQVPEAAEWAPHVSVAYANSNGPANAINAALGDGRGETATVRAVELIRLGRDRHLYEWKSIETLPLGGQAED
jgi:2'-5' RNA ligase